MAFANPHVHENTDDDSSGAILFPCIGRDNSIACLIRCSRSDYDAISALNNSFRALVKSDELYKLRRINGVVEHWVYFSCGLHHWYAFDPNRRRWKRLPPMGCNQIFMCADKESLGVGTHLLVIGRDIFSQLIYRYSLVTNAWSSGMQMNQTRWLFASANIGEIGIFAGGCNAAGQILSSAELYNSDTGTWTPLPSMNKARKMCSGVFMDGKFYVVGGQGEPNHKLLSCGEEYDLDTGKWTLIPNMSPVPTFQRGGNRVVETTEAPPPIAVVNNQLYAADHVNLELNKYEKDRREWITLGKLPTSTSCVNGWGMGFRGCGERLIVISGPRTISGTGIIEVNSWVPSDGAVEWTLLGWKHSANFVYNCAIIGC